MSQGRDEIEADTISKVVWSVKKVIDLLVQARYGELDLLTQSIRMRPLKALE